MGLARCRFSVIVQAIPNVTEISAMALFAFLGFGNKV